MKYGIIIAALLLSGSANAQSNHAYPVNAHKR